MGTLTEKLKLKKRNKGILEKRLTLKLNQGEYKMSSTGIHESRHSGECYILYCQAVRKK